MLLLRKTQKKVSGGPSHPRYQTCSLHPRRPDVKHHASLSAIVQPLVTRYNSHVKSNNSTGKPVYTLNEFSRSSLTNNCEETKDKHIHTKKTTSVHKTALKQVSSECAFTTQWSENSKLAESANHIISNWPWFMKRCKKAHKNLNRKQNHLQLLHVWLTCLKMCTTVMITSPEQNNLQELHVWCA